MTFEEPADAPVRYEVEVHRWGRWRWCWSAVEIHKIELAGRMVDSPMTAREIGFAWGRQRAESHARRAVERRKRTLCREAATTTRFTA